MAKTSPIGVRFDEELLGKVKESGVANSPQRALNLYEKSYVKLVELTEKGLSVKSPEPDSVEESVDRELVLKAIEVIKSEKIPAARNTFYGKKSWQQEQDEKIEELEKLLK